MIDNLNVLVIKIFNLIRFIFLKIGEVNDEGKELFRILIRIYCYVYCMNVCVVLNILSKKIFFVVVCKD